MRIDNLIIIHGGSYNEIKKALKQWINLYSSHLYKDFSCELHTSSNGQFIIIADPKLDNERFFYLINYLKYPEGIKYDIELQGYTFGKENNRFKRLELLVYISANDCEYDNVFVTTSENESFKIDFGGKITICDESQRYKFPVNIVLGKSENIKLQDKEFKSNTTESSKSPIEKRFQLISIIILIAFTLTFLFFKTDVEFLNINDFIAFSAYGWLVFDYKMLQINKLYFYSFILALMIFIYGLYINQNYKVSLPIMSASIIMPIFFLILQRPFRILFIKLTGREPIVEQPSPSIVDFIYIFILWMLSTLIPVFYYEKLGFLNT